MVREDASARFLGIAEGTLVMKNAVDLDRAGRAGR